ncbi:MAG: PepSY domain-containing protein [Clostridia bacterium]|nr:PepSY domain-containing protein [Clostridia bacterium]
MKKPLAALLLMMMLTAQAETLPEGIFWPEGTEILSESAENDLKTLTLALPDGGEVLLLTLDALTGEPISLITETPAQAQPDPDETRADAESAVIAACPGAKILFAEDDGEGGRRLYTLSETLCGAVSVRGGKIVARSLAFGRFLDGGQLTAEGAAAALTLLRPGAEILELEKDEDDGLTLYEGEAILDGAEYEFELDALSGKLLEWERD